MKAQFTFERRRNYNGVMCVAPFIEGYNVWDIPETQWGTAVASAIRRAYEIGYMRATHTLGTGPAHGGEWEEVK